MVIPHAEQVMGWLVKAEDTQAVPYSALRKPGEFPKLDMCWRSSESVFCTTRGRRLQQTTQTVRSSSVGRSSLGFQRPASVSRSQFVPITALIGRPKSLWIVTPEGIQDMITSINMELSRLSALPRWTSLQLNVDTVSGPHKDAGNEGLSAILAFGP